MPYIGRTTDGFGVRNRFFFTASSGDTSVSGSDTNGRTLQFVDGLYVDVYLNGVLLDPTVDYNTTTANTVAGLSALATDDRLEIIVYDTFTVGDVVSAASGGTFGGAVSMSSTLAVTGATTLTGGIANGVTINGTTPTLTIGDAGAEDTKIVFDGNAQDFHVGLDDSADDLVVGVGSALGTTTAFAVDENAVTTFSKSVVGKTDTDTSNSGTVDLDFQANTNFVLTLTGNITSLTASNEVAGQSGFIVFIQDGTGGRTVSLHGDYETAGGAGITLTSTASATDIVPYVVAASSRILLGAPQLAFS
jgi:fibronectin-binding autotransporter adhesin